MMDTSKRELRVGIFVVAVVGLFVALMGVVSGATLTGERISHTLRFEETVKGMVVGSRVNFQGVPIGAVTDMRFDAGTTLVEIEVDPQKAELQAVTRAHIDRALVTGQVTIELEGYQPGGVALVPGAAIPVHPNLMQELALDLPEMSAAGTQALRSAQQVLDRFALLLDDQTIEAARAAAAGLARTASELPERVAAIEAETRSTLAEVRALVAETRGAVEQVTPEIEGSAGDLRAALQRADAALVAIEHVAGGAEVLREDLSLVAGEAERLLSQNQQAVRGLLIEARDAMRELRGLARQLRATPSSLLFGIENQEIDVPRRGREDR